MSALYNQIGDGYDTTRTADPEIVATFRRLLRPENNKAYVDIACGTGNYTAEMAKLGGLWLGFDHSHRMLAAAKTKSDRVTWHHCDVEQTGFSSAQFDGATCSLAIHHFAGLALAFKETGRILKPTAKLVIFTATPGQMQSYWLRHYFPVMMQQSWDQMPSLRRLEESLLGSGMNITSTLPFYITPNLQDFFLYSGKHRPEMYLSAEVRAGISSYRRFCSDHELENGLSALRKDIATGEIQAVVEKYHSDIGDYLFITASKAKNTNQGVSSTAHRD